MTTTPFDNDGDHLWQRIKKQAVPLSREEIAPQIPQQAPQQAPQKALQGREAEKHKPPRTRLITDTLPKNITAKGQNHTLPPLVIGNLRQRGLGRLEAKDMMTGRMSIDMSIDLHGFSLDDARHEVHHALRRAYGSGQRLIHVITGKGDRQSGSGIIRESFCAWLNESHVTSMVLAVCYAVGRHGGEGAFYVRVKRGRAMQGRAMQGRAVRGRAVRGRAVHSTRRTP